MYIYVCICIYIYIYIYIYFDEIIIHYYSKYVKITGIESIVSGFQGVFENEDSVYMGGS